MFEIIEVQKKEPIDGAWIHSSADEKGDLSDGYHTFSELYEHRITLYIQLCKMYSSHVPMLPGRGYKRKQVWRSLIHSDGSTMDGWFLLGIGTEPGEQITYHLPFKDWTKCNFAETLEKAPKFDLHSSADVLERISKL